MSEPLEMPAAFMSFGEYRSGAAHRSSIDMSRTVPPGQKHWMSQYVDDMQGCYLESYLAGKKEKRMPDGIPVTI